MNKPVLILFFVLISSFLFAQEEDYVQEDYVPVANEAIYTSDTVIWFGADFSLFRLSNKKKVGEDEKLIRYVYAWNENYKSSISNVKLASLLLVKKVFNDKEFTNKAYEQFLPEKWIITEKNSITRTDIQNHLSNVTSSHNGLGLIYILECFYKSDPSAVLGYFVWFDIDSKEIIYISTKEGTPSTSHFSSYGMEVSKRKGLPVNKGMTGYWLQGMIDASLKFGIEYKEKKQALKKE